MLDEKNLKAKLRELRDAGGAVPDDAEAALRNGETVVVPVRDGEASQDALRKAFDLEREGNAVMAVAVDTTDDPANIAAKLKGGNGRLIVVRDPWPTSKTAERAAWFTAMFEAGGGFALAATAGDYGDAIGEGMQVFGLAEALNATGALSHTFQLVPRQPCECGCGAIIEADEKMVGKNLLALAHLQADVEGAYLQLVDRAAEGEHVSVMALYSPIQRRVMLPQPVAVSLAHGPLTADAVRAIVGEGVVSRMVNGGGAWLMFATSDLESGKEACIIDVAVPEYTKADSTCTAVMAAAHALIEAGVLTALDGDRVLPRAKSYTLGAERLALVGYIRADKLPNEVGIGLARVALGDIQPATQLASAAEVRYRGRAILAAASLDYAKEHADRALLNKGQHSLVETACLAIMRAGALLSALGEQGMGSHVPRGMAAAFVATAHPGFYEDVIDFGKYGLSNMAQLFPSSVLRFAVAAMMVKRFGNDAAATAIEAAQNACEVTAQAIFAQCEADDLGGDVYLERTEQAACAIWWNAWHGQSAN
jgi:hypothetical protein